jgi:hypothetical protein
MAKTKAERLEEALRANLKKRKAQERARTQNPDTTPQPLEPESNPR